MLLGLIVLASSALSGEAKRCDIVVGELVPNAHVALALADVIIRGRQTPEERSRYLLHVEPDGETGWFVFQGLPNGPPDAKGNVTVTAGGGGLGMRIDKCNGEISSVYYQR